MVRVKRAIDELRELVTSEGTVDEFLDHYRCRRLVLRATSKMSDLSRAAELNDRLNLRLYMVDLGPIIGAEREPYVQEILDILDEIEALSRPE